MIAIIIFSVCMLYPIFIIIFVQIFHHRFDDLYFKNHFSALYSELNNKKRTALLYNIFFMVRRILFSVNALVLTAYPYAQI